MFIKSEQDGRRLRTSSDGNVNNGRLFIQFVALVLNCIIYRKFFASKELQKLFPTRQHMLEELRSIKLIRHPLRAKIITEVVGRQVDVFREFRLPVPAKSCQRNAARSLLMRWQRRHSAIISCKTHIGCGLQFFSVTPHTLHAYMRHLMSYYKIDVFFLAKKTLLNTKKRQSDVSSNWRQ